MTINLPTDLQNLTSGLQLGNIGGLADGISYKKYASTQNAMTASTTQTQAAGTVILYHISRFTTVSNPNDAATLGFAALPGRSFVIINDSGNILQLFPRLGDTLCDAGLNNSVSIADNTVSKYYCPVANLWFGGATTLET